MQKRKKKKIEYVVFKYKYTFFILKNGINYNQYETQPDLYLSLGGLVSQALNLLRSGRIWDNSFVSGVVLNPYY